MNNLILVINSGSSSLKFGLFHAVIDQSTTGEPLIETLCRGSLEWIELNSIFNVDFEDYSVVETQVIDATKNIHFESIEQAQTLLVEWLNRFITPDQIATVCYRVVHGGELYHQPVEINQQVLQNLKSLIPLAPLHQPCGINAIKVFMKSFPIAIHKACFDTAFHCGMPKVAQTFAIPQCLSAKGIKPYGFHGLSYQYIKTKLKELIPGEFPARVVVAHLGSGASLCGLLNGSSISTTMSFTPMDGLPMSTRCGAIDAGAVLFMANQLKLSTNEISNLLNNQSGLLGLSGVSGDIRQLINSDSADAKFALEFFVYRIWQELGALIGLLQGIDVLVFTGGAGAHCWQVRQNVCEQFQWMGISLNQDANQRNEVLISDSKSKVHVFAIKTDEEMMMAKLAT